MNSSVFFASPWWLAGLIPWAGLIFYLLWGQRRGITVPFLPLWQESSQLKNEERRWKFPPPAIVAALFSALLAVIAAAGPRVRWAGERSARPVIVIADRGLTMSAHHRLASLAGQSGPLIGKVIGNGVSDLIAVPASGTRVVDGGSLSAEIAALAPTAMDTKSDLEIAERNALADPRALVVVLSDQASEVSDARLVQIVPGESFSGIGIARFAVRATPSPQAMVRLQNDSSQTRATLNVSGSGPVEVQLPPRGKTADYFVELANAPQVVEAFVESGGEAGACAWAVRGGSWPKVLEQGVLPEELHRLIDVYRRHRPPGDGSATLAIVSMQSNLDSDQPAAVIVPEEVPTTADHGAVHVSPSEITTGIDWGAAASLAQTADLQPDSSWQKLVWTDRHVLVAIRTAGRRQAWVGIRPGEWAATTDFVVFWTKTLDWIGKGDDRYQSQSVGPLTADWKPVGFTVASSDNGLLPGLYRNGPKMAAVNAVPPQGDWAAATDWRGKLGQLASQQETVFDAAPLAILAALGFLIVSARGLAGKPHYNPALN